MANVVQSMIHSVLGDGARSTKFECIVGIDTFSGSSKDIATLVKSSQFPGKFHDVIDLKFKGRNIPIKGQTRYDNTWTCTFYLTEDHSLKKSFEDYIESLDNHNFDDVSDEVYSKQIKNDSGYTTTVTIVQLDFDGTQECSVYKLYNAFPKSVSAVDVDYSEVGKVQEFTVEFSYSHFDSVNLKSNDGSFIDKTKKRFLGALNGLVQKGKNELIRGLSSVISNSAELFKTSGAGGIFSSIGSAISSGIGFLEQIDFSPSEMIE